MENTYEKIQNKLGGLLKEKKATEELLYSEAALDSMTVKELRALSESLGVELDSGYMKKSDIIKEILEDSEEEELPVLDIGKSEVTIVEEKEEPDNEKPKAKAAKGVRV